MKFLWYIRMLLRSQYALVFQSTKKKKKNNIFSFPINICAILIEVFLNFSIRDDYKLVRVLGAPYLSHRLQKQHFCPCNIKSEAGLLDES